MKEEKNKNGEARLMKGNEALAEAAIRADIDAYFGYPITPQSEILEYLEREIPNRHGLVIQAESEVASINMIYGAAGAGVERYDRRRLARSQADGHVAGAAVVDDVELAGEARGQREARDRERADNAAHGCQGHRPEQTAEIRAFRETGTVNDGTGAHEQQRLVQDMCKCVRGSTIDGHLCADTDSADHESDLVHDRIGKNAAYVVLQKCVDNAVHHHEETDADEHRLTRE